MTQINPGVPASHEKSRQSGSAGDGDLVDLPAAGFPVPGFSPEREQSGTRSNQIAGEEQGLEGRRDLAVQRPGMISFVGICTGPNNFALWLFSCGCQCLLFRSIAVGFYI